MTGAGMIWASFGLVLVVVAAIGAQPAGGLKPGDMAPAFMLPGSDGRAYNLADFKGKQAVLLAWFPKAFTAG